MVYHQNVVIFEKNTLRNGQVHLCLEVLLVSRSSQGQHNGISDLQHGLQNGCDHNEEDDGEEEGSVDDLKLNEACLDCQDQQGDSLGHPSAERKQAGGSRRHVDNMAAANHMDRWTHLCMVLSFMKALQPCRQNLQSVRTPRAMKETVKTKPSKEYGVLQHSAILITDNGKTTDDKKKSFRHYLHTCTMHN